MNSRATAKSNDTVQAKREHRAEAKVVREQASERAERQLHQFVEFLREQPHHGVRLHVADVLDPRDGVVTAGFAPRTIMGNEVPLMFGSRNRFHRFCCSMYGRMSTAQLGESSDPLERPHGITPTASWWVSLQTGARLAFGLALWGTWWLAGAG